MKSIEVMKRISIRKGGIRERGVSEYTRNIKRQRRGEGEVGEGS